jgi:hypothetical protein
MDTHHLAAVSSPVRAMPAGGQHALLYGSLPAATTGVASLHLYTALTRSPKTRNRYMNC